MKLLFLHPSSWTGEYALLAHLARQGETIYVLEEDRRLGTARKRAFFFREPGDRIETLWYDPARGAMRLATWPADRVFRGAFDGRNLVHRMTVILEAIERFAPDVVLCSDGFSYAIPAALLRRLGLMKVPLLVTCIGGDLLDVPYGDYGHRRTPRVNWLLGQMVRGADALRPVSPLLEDALLALGAGNRRLTVLPSHLTAPEAVLQAARSRKGEATAAIRARYGIPAHAPLVITLSNNGKAKGIQVMAAAWSRIRTAFPQCVWLLAGPDDPWLERGVRPLLAQADSVIATGALAQHAVYEHLAAADLHIAPSLAEGLNMVVVEAAAVDTPSVVGSGAGIAAWVERCEFGAVAASGDPDALAVAVCGALSDRDKLSRWRANCAPVASEFALERIAARLTALARELVI